MIAAQLFEQFQAAAVGQHHIEHHRIGSLVGQGAACAVAIMAGADLETFLGQPVGQQLAQFDVVVD
ncbi:hypothetical protein D3C80_1249950 [compost metagenome]